MKRISKSQISGQWEALPLKGNLKGNMICVFPRQGGLLHRQMDSLLHNHTLSKSSIDSLYKMATTINKNGRKIKNQSRHDLSKVSLVRKPDYKKESMSFGADTLAVNQSEVYRTPIKQQAVESHVKVPFLTAIAVSIPLSITAGILSGSWRFALVSWALLYIAVFWSRLIVGDKMLENVEEWVSKLSDSTDSNSEKPETEKRERVPIYMDNKLVAFAGEDVIAGVNNANLELFSWVVLSNNWDGGFSRDKVCSLLKSKGKHLSQPQYNLIYAHLKSNNFLKTGENNVNEVGREFLLTHYPPTPL